MSLLPPLAARANRRFDVVAFGECSLDFVGIGLRPPVGADKATLSSFDLHVGGQASTAAVACARQGLRARYVGAFGGDEWGGAVKRALARDGVDVVAIEHQQTRSRVAMVLVDSENGDRTVFEFRDSGLSTDPATLPHEALMASRVLILDATDLAASARVARMARTAGIPTVVDVDRVDPAVRGLLADIDVIVVGRAFLEAWTGRKASGEALAVLAHEFQPAVAVVTLGAEGSLALAGGREIRTPGFPVDVADSTGAGDAFRGGFASAWVRLAASPRLEEILEQANATAALNCRAVGAQAGLPRLTELRGFCNTGRPRPV